MLCLPYLALSVRIFPFSKALGLDPDAGDVHKFTAVEMEGMPGAVVQVAASDDRSSASPLPG